MENRKVQATKKTSEPKNKTKEKSKDDITSKKENEKLKKSVFSVSTPRPYLQQSTTADIYSRQNSALKAPKKSTQPTTKTNVSPMKNLLRASPSLSQIKNTNSKKAADPVKSVKAKACPDTARSNRTPRTAKSLPFSNVTVNSPVVKRKLVSEFESKPEDATKNSSYSNSDKSKVSVSKEPDYKGERQRSKTRTLDDDEVKVLTPHALDNNAEMLNLSNKLKAQPKAYFVDLNGEQSQKEKEPSDEEVSYEDDFESYESDFDSYHSTSSETNPNDRDSEESDAKRVEEDFQTKDEKMLDSGTFELRDRSAKSKPMDFIIEDPSDKKVSLTDEGFQEMSSCSAVSSMKTVHLDVLERPLFIDFTKSKENRKKRRIFEKLKQRAKDILSMVTLHEMSFTLFEMKPIPYDLYMATFGRSNYTQVAVQTFDDGITQEVQTEDIEYNNKWTQHPIEFSNESICVSTEEKVNKNEDNVLVKISKIINFEDKSAHVEIDESYRNNHLRIYLEQKDGVGNDSTLPIANYNAKIKQTDFNVINLRKFLKKVEGRLSNILSANSGSQMSNLVSTSKFPFSKEYVSISMKNFKNRKDNLMKDTNISGIVFSESKSNLLFTLHDKCKNVGTHKTVGCLWDLNIAMLEPIKFLFATDYVEIARFIGSSDGIFVAALKDGTVHLWDLSEETNWFDNEFYREETVDKDVKNNVNRNLGQCNQTKRHASAYTSSASNMTVKDSTEKIVGLEFVTGNTIALENGNKVVGQICILRKMGVLTFYSIIQEKHKKVTQDIGKAFWSRMRLEEYQNINLFEYYVPIYNELDNNLTDFNLNVAKKRLLNKRNDRNLTRGNSRQKSAITKFDSDRPHSAARGKKIISHNSNWETGIVCTSLKIINFNNVDNYLVAKNCGEVLNCKRTAGAIKVERYNVTCNSSVITYLEASSNDLPYFLAATDIGTIHLCSLLTTRVLLTLDCRKSPVLPERYQVDSKGRYVGTVPSKSGSENVLNTNMSVTSLVWATLYIIVSSGGGRVDVWQLAHSDIHPYNTCAHAGVLCTSRDRNLALLNMEGDVEIYKMNANNDEQLLEVFKRYVSLL